MSIDVPDNGTTINDLTWFYTVQKKLPTAISALQSWAFSHPLTICLVSQSSLVAL